MTSAPEHPNQELAAVMRRLWSAIDHPAFGGVDALAVGGSMSRGCADAGSDLDLYVVSRAGQDPVEVGHTLVGWLGASPLVRGPVRVSHFGLSFTAVMPALAVCQINVNPIDDVELNAMRSRSQIVFDRSGALTELVGRSTTLPSVPEECFRDNVVWFWQRALFGWGAACRGQLWRALGYLHDMQRAMLVMVRLREGRFDAADSPHHPAIRAEDDLGDSCLELAGASAAYDREDIIHAYQFASAWFLSESETLRRRFASDADAHACARQIADRIAGP